MCFITMNDLRSTDDIYICVLILMLFITLGARQVMHSITKKLISHTTEKLTNHVSSAIKSTMTKSKLSIVYRMNLECKLL